MSAGFAWRCFKASVRLSFLMTLWLLSILAKASYAQTKRRFRRA